MGQSSMDPELQALIDEELDRVYGGSQFEDHPSAGRFFKPDAKAAVTPLSLRAHRKSSAMGDNVVLPKHYSRFQIEPIKFIGENRLNFFQGNVVKYILRYDAKNGLEDVRKAKRYCRMFELYLMDYPDWAGPDPIDKELQEMLEGIFAKFRALAQTVGDLAERSKVLAGITIIEAEYNGAQRPA